MTTRTDLVVKKVNFHPQSGDEEGSRRQKRAIFAPKW